MINNAEKTANDTTVFQNSIKELCNAIQTLTKQTEGTISGKTVTAFANKRMGDGEKDACFVCN